jgi:hypothetical protein
MLGAVGAALTFLRLRGLLSVTTPATSSSEVRLWPQLIDLWALPQRSNPRPSDYESKSLRPAGAIQARSGCSRQRGRPASVFPTCRVTAGGMTKRMTDRS